MAVAFDAGFESHTSTTGSTSEASFTWTHTPVGTPAGVLVYVFNLSSTTDTASGVTYGGITVPAVSSGRAVDSDGGEPGSSKVFFLGDISAIPTGAKSVVVTRTNNSDVMYAVSITVTAASGYGTRSGAPTLTQNDGSVAEVSVADTSGTNSVRFAGGFFGHQSPPSTGASSTAVQSIDTGAVCAVVTRETTAGTGSRAVGMSSGTSDDRAIVTLAISESPVPAKGALTFAGTLTTLAFAAAVSVGALALAGPAPAVSIDTGSTVPVSNAALTFAGPTLSLAFKGPDTGALALAGETPAVSVGGLPLPAAGALALAGTTPTVSLTIPVASGALALDGQLPVRVVDGPGGTTRTPLQGALTLSGQATYVAFQGPTTGALALTGPAPTASVVAPSTSRAPAAGALTLAGSATYVAFQGPTTGAVALAGQALIARVQGAIPLGTLTLGGSMIEVRFKGPATGQMALTGQLPLMLVEGARLPAVGALTLAGTTPVLQSTVPIAVKALALTGQAVTVARGVPIGVGALVLAGQALDAPVTQPGSPNPSPAALTFGGNRVGTRFKGPDTGSIAFAGVAPTIAVAGNTGFTPAAGGLTLAGSYFGISFEGALDEATLTLVGPAPAAVVTAVTDNRMLPGVGTLTLAGQAPALREAIQRAPAVAALTLTGPTPVMANSLLRAIGVGALALTGRTPVTVVPTTVAVPVGTLTFSGTTPVEGIGGSSPLPRPAAAALTLTGYAPTVLLPVVVAVPSGALTLTGGPLSIETPVAVTLRGSYVRTLTLRGSNASTLTLRGSTG